MIFFFLLTRMFFIEQMFKHVHKYKLQSDLAMLIKALITI